MTTTRDDGHGCEAFGHLASPFVDDELPRAEQDRFATHLGSCAPCRKVTEDFRALDVAAMGPVPAVDDARWGFAWQQVHRTIQADRAAAAIAPAAGLGRVAAWRPAGGWPRVVRPLAYLAAAATLIAVLLSLQSRLGDGQPDGPVTVTARATPAAAARPAGVTARIRSIACKAPDYVPVVFTTDGDEPITVVQCAFIGNET